MFIFVIVFLLRGGRDVVDMVAVVVMVVIVVVFGNSLVLVMVLVVVLVCKYIFLVGFRCLPHIPQPLY